MLKIKDNVDLKELEKYGLVYEKLYSQRTGEFIEDYMLFGNNVFIKNDKTIRLMLLNSFAFVESTEKLAEILYDLIKDGLVEKVEE